MPGLKNNQRIEVSGISLTPGVAIGKAFRFKQIDLESLLSNTFPIENITVELKRLQNAIQKVKISLTVYKKLHLKTVKTMSPIYSPPTFSSFRMKHSFKTYGMPLNLRGSTLSTFFQSIYGKSKTRSVP